MLAVSNFSSLLSGRNREISCLWHLPVSGQWSGILFLFYNKTFALLIWNLHTDHARPRSVTENKMSVKLDVKDAYGLTHGLDPRK